MLVPGTVIVAEPAKVMPLAANVMRVGAVSEPVAANETPLAENTICVGAVRAPVPENATPVVPEMSGAPAVIEPAPEKTTLLEAGVMNVGAAGSSDSAAFGSTASDA